MNSLPLEISIQILNMCNFKDLIRFQLVCQSFYKYINTHPELFWYKNPIKFYLSPYNCRGCVAEDIVTGLSHKMIMYELQPLGLEIQDPTPIYIIRRFC